MEIIKKEIELCEKCNDYVGFVKEKYNGCVPVFCQCDLRDQNKLNQSRGPSMVATGKDKLYWTPISYYKNKDGDTISVPYFTGIRINEERKND